MAASLPLEIGCLSSGARQAPVEEMIRSELDAVLSRPRYGRRRKEIAGEEISGVAGHRQGSRTRTLIGTFGKTEIAVPRARLATAEGKTTEWKSEAVRQSRGITQEGDVDGWVCAARLSRREPQARHP